MRKVSSLGGTGPRNWRRHVTCWRRCVIADQAGISVDPVDEGLAFCIGTEPKGQQSSVTTKIFDPLFLRASSKKTLFFLSLFSILFFFLSNPIAFAPTVVHTDWFIFRPVPAESVDPWPEFLGSVRPSVCPSFPIHFFFFSFYYI